MIAAFKFPPPFSTIIPFSAILKVWKVGHSELAIVVSSAGSNNYKCVSKDDRDQQYSNFETWLTIKTNSI